nr:hypothetical protein [Lysinibacillus timonensis]
MLTFEFPIPQTTLNQLRHFNFQWTMTISEDPYLECRNQVASNERYYQLRNIVVNNYYYEMIEINFVKGLIRIKTPHANQAAIENIFEALTLHTSPTSMAFYTMSPNKRMKK